MSLGLGMENRGPTAGLRVREEPSAGRNSGKLARQTPRRQLSAFLPRTRYNRSQTQCSTLPIPIPFCPRFRSIGIGRWLKRLRAHTQSSHASRRPHREMMDRRRRRVRQAPTAIPIPMPTPAPPSHADGRGTLRQTRRPVRWTEAPGEATACPTRHPTPGQLHPSQQTPRAVTSVLARSPITSRPALHLRQETFTVRSAPSRRRTRSPESPTLKRVRLPSAGHLPCLLPLHVLGRRQRRGVCSAGDSGDSALLPPPRSPCCAIASETPGGARAA